MFETGMVVATPGIMDALDAGDMTRLLARHVRGDWGDVCDEDKNQNNEAVKNGDRVLSAYETDKGKIWIITEADRSLTTFLLPEEY